MIDCRRQDIELDALLSSSDNRAFRFSQSAERASATVAETKGSHALYASKPKAVADFIEKAASAK